MSRLIKQIPLVLLIAFLVGSSTRADQIVFSDDFEFGVSSQFSGQGVATGVQGYAGFGTGSNQFSGTFLRNEGHNGIANGVTLSLANLPSHNSVDIDFLLAVIDSWDGVGSGHGPDTFAVSVDGTTVFSKVFENSGSGTQSYTPPVGVTLARKLNLGFRPPGSFFLDSAYNMGLDPVFDNIAHTSDSLTISWFRNGGSIINSPSFVDESWALDNVTITLNGTAVPEPTSLPLLAAAAIWGAAYRRRTNSPRL